MTYYGSKDLAASFLQVRGNTIQIAEDIPDNKYAFKATPESLSIGQTLVHVALSPSFQNHVHRNKIRDLKDLNVQELFQQFAVDEAKPRTEAEIIALLKTEGESFASYVEGLPEAFLAEQVAMPPGAEPATTTRFEMLLSPKEHEIHHRGQLMVLQRMIGLVPHLTRLMQERMARRSAEAQAPR